MNKNDIKLIIIILLIASVFFLSRLINNEKANLAYVYYGNELILTIDLSIDSDYVVNGDNGEVLIKVLDKKIKVESENSPYHLCSKQGFISNSGESIVCLPNKIIIELSSNDSIDTEVR